MWKKPIFYLTILFIFCACFFGSKKSFATHAAGGELLYEWTGGSTYKIIFKFYRDCGGASQPSSQVVCYKNTCNSVSGTINLNAISTLPGGNPNGTPVSTGCAGSSTECDNPSSTVPGYREWWYEGTITLPSQCDSWIFTTSVSNRNTSNNLLGVLNLFIEARLNNLNAQGNSSPYFSVKPVPYVCINQPYTFNNRAVDPNNDSLVFEVLNPLHGSGCSATPTNAPFTSKTPPLSIPSNPFQTNNT